MKYDHSIRFLAGVIAGTAGIAVLSSREAKKIYTHCTAAVLRGKNCIMKKAAVVKENCGDIYADAKDINDIIAEQQKAVEVENAKAIVEQYENCENNEENSSEVTE